MAVAVNIISSVVEDPSQGLDSTRTRLIVEGTLTLSGNYGGVASNGDTVSFAGFDVLKTSLPPVFVEIKENQGAGVAPLGYGFLYAKGTTLANGVLTILGTSAAGGAKVGATQFTQGDAYSTGTPSLNGAVLRFRAAFVKMV